MGKTSLLNTLVFGSADVAPSSQNGACTSAICCFKYHKANGGDNKFKAIIRFKTKAAVDLEISRFFEDRDALKDMQNSEEHQSSATQEDRLQAKELEHSIKDQLDRIRGWSGLSVEEIISFGSADTTSITRACKGSYELFSSLPDQSQEVVFTCSTANAFSQKLRRYISSAGSRSRSRSEVYWPIVELAEIYSPSPVLRDCPGLVLVDLPGETDASEARSEVAHRYYNRLEGILVVTPADRATDNRTAMDFILNDHLCDLEANGKLQSNSLATMVTKIDLMDWKSYVSHEEEPSDISEDFPEMLGAYDEQRSLLEEVQEELQDLEENLSQIQQNDDTTKKSPHSSKRVHEYGEETAQEVIELKKKQLQLLQQRTTLDMDIETLHGKCLRACIDFRSRSIEQHLRAIFDERRNQYRGNRIQTVIQVLPVSSKAQQDLLKREPMLGFANSEDTGYDALARWITNCSIPRREEHADNILHRSLVLSDAVGMDQRE